jgi:hypothetical protein
MQKKIIFFFPFNYFVTIFFSNIPSHIPLQFVISFLSPSCFQVSLITTILLHSRCHDNSLHRTTLYWLDRGFQLGQRETIFFFTTSVLTWETETPLYELGSEHYIPGFRWYEHQLINHNHFYTGKATWGHHSTPPNDFMLYGETKQTQSNMSLFPLAWWSRLLLPNNYCT